MAGALTSLLITVLILGIIAGVAWAIWQIIAPRIPAPFGQIIAILFWAIIAIVLILYVLVPLIHMLPAAVGA